MERITRIDFISRRSNRNVCGLTQLAGYNDLEVGTDAATLIESDRSYLYDGISITVNGRDGTVI